MKALQQNKLSTYLLHLFVTTCFLSSCIINIKGLTNGYKKLNTDDKKRILFGHKDCVGQYSDTIYAFNGKDFKNCLISDDTSVVYRWDPNCSSKSCIPLTLTQYYCDKKKYTLYLLLEYFDLPKQKILGSPTKSIIISDFKYYKSNFVDAYTNSFIEDLTSLDKKNTLIRYKRFLFFKNGEFLFAKENLYE